MPKFKHGAHGLIYNEDGRYLVTQRAPDDDYMPLKWELPGGGTDLYESVEDTLFREVLEETNLIVRSVELMWVLTNTCNPETNIQGISFVYLCNEFTGTVKLSNEHIDYKWATSDEIFELDVIWHLRQVRELYMGGIPPMRMNNLLPWS